MHFIKKVHNYENDDDDDDAHEGQVFCSTAVVGSVVAISSEWWGDGSLGAEPLVRGPGRRSPLKLKKIEF